MVVLFFRKVAISSALDEDRDEYEVHQPEIEIPTIAVLPAPYIAASQLPPPGGYKPPEGAPPAGTSSPPMVIPSAPPDERVLPVPAGIPVSNVAPTQTQIYQTNAPSGEPLPPTYASPV